MAIKTSTVTTRALRRKEFFQWPPIVLPHTFTTLTSNMALSIISSAVSVLIGHVFGFSNENVNIPFQYAWIASLLGAFGSFLSVDFFCEFYFPFAVFLSIYFVFL